MSELSNQLTTEEVEAKLAERRRIYINKTKTGYHYERKEAKREKIQMDEFMYKAPKYALESDFQKVVYRWFIQRGYKILKQRDYVDIVSIKHGVTYITELKRDINSSSLHNVVGQLMLRRYKRRPEQMKVIYQACFPHRYEKDFPKSLIEFLLEYEINVLFI